MASSRYHTLTNAELEQYFDRIRLPTKIRPNFMARRRSFLVDLDTITDILNCHLRDVPFENLALHYSQRRAIDVDARSVYDKIVIQRRGGYGLEHNLLLNTVLLNLGLDAYMAGARLWDPKLSKYSGVEHCVNIVAIRGCPWLVDAGIGPNGPIKPIELANRAPFSHLYGTTGRITQTPIAQATPLYCFVETELFPEDIEIMNLKISTTPTSAFIPRVFASRCLAAVDFEYSGDMLISALWDDHSCHGRSRICGQLILIGNYIELRRDGEGTINMPIMCEQDRVFFLRELFNLELPEHDIKAIKGTTSDLDKL